MKTTNQGWALGVAAAIAIAAAVGACKEGTPDTPPAPAVPAGWTVKMDNAIPSAAFAAVEAKLGGKLAALRNTVYDAHGKTVQINTMKAATPADEDKLIKGITGMKPAWSVIKNGDVVYELVGENDATAEMKAEHDLLAK